jgi:D-3-phosphoglycerate dehydrogenase
MAGTRKKLLLPSTMARIGWDVLAARSDVEAIAYDPAIEPKPFHALLADADGVALSLTRFTEAEVRASPMLRVVARHGVGYDAVDVAALTRRRIPLMVTGTANSPSVAEHALYFMLALAKRGAALNAMVREARWKDRLAEELPMDLYGKTVLVVGFGRIGMRVARMCIAIGMTVSVYDPYVNVATMKIAGCRPESDLERALPRADFVTIHCPRTTETSGMFNAPLLQRMKPTAFLINTARGGIIDETALYVALVKGEIRGAALDVFDSEPIAPDNPLLTLPSVIVAPHMAGVTRESLDRMAVSVANNLLAVLDGRPEMDNVVNKEIYTHR